MTKARTLADNFAADINGITASSPLTGGGTTGTVTVGVQAGTTAQSGAVQLTDSTASTSTATAATPNSVKSAYDLANGAIAKSIVDAKGDLIVATGSDTVSRLAVASTAGYLLSVDSAEATGLKWAAPAAAGGMTLISSTSMSTGASISLTSIPQTYKSLYFVTSTMSNQNAAEIYVTFNTETFGGASATYIGMEWNGSSAGNYGQSTDANGWNLISVRGTNNIMWGIINNYTQASTIKTCYGGGGTITSQVTSRLSANITGNTAAITSILFTHSGSGSSRFQGGTLYLYGIG